MIWQRGRESTWQVPNQVNTMVHQMDIYQVRKLRNDVILLRADQDWAQGEAHPKGHLNLSSAQGATQAI